MGGFEKSSKELPSFSLRPGNGHTVVLAMALPTQPNNQLLFIYPRKHRSL
jgi:hypothetical protein